MSLFLIFLFFHLGLLMTCADFYLCTLSIDEGVKIVRIRWLIIFMISYELVILLVGKVRS